MSGTEKFQNANLGSSLVGGISAVATTLTVADASKFQTNGSFRIVIDSEYIIVPVGGVVGATFTNLIRGAEGSTPATHFNGATVTQIVTAQSAFQTWPNYVYASTKTSPYTANPQEFVTCDASGGGFPVTLPLAAVAGPNCPVTVSEIQAAGSGLNVVSVVPSGGDTIPWTATPTLRQETVTFISDGVSRWYVLGGKRIAPTPSVFNVQDFGAVGDGVHDDTAAINAANTAAMNYPTANAGAGMVYFPNPRVAYAVSSTIVCNWRAHWKGEAVNIQNGIIRAIAPMRAIVSLRTSIGNPLEGPGTLRAWFENLTFDGNNQIADYGILAISAEDGQFDDVYYVGCGVTGFRVGNQQGVSVGAVNATCPGGSPTNVTVAQIDQNYTGLGALQTPGTYSFSIKCTLGGALDTAQFVYNFNGTGYTTVNQPISATSLPAFEFPVGGVPALIYNLGLSIGFPPGPYFSGDHWNTTLTSVAVDYGAATGGAPNLNMNNPCASLCGIAYASSGAQAYFLGKCNLQVVPGTIALTAGSTTVIGTGTQFTQMKAAGKAMMGLRTSTSPDPITAQVAAILSDTVLVLSPDPATLAKITTISGVAFGIGVGGLFEEDGLSEAGDQLIIGGQCSGCPIGFRFNSTHGPILIRHEFFGCPLVGGMFGYAAAASTIDCQIIGCQIDSGCPVGYYFGQGSGGTWQVPKHRISFAGSPLSWLFSGSDGAFGGLSTFLQLILQPLSEVLQTTSVNITSHATTLPVPTLDVVNGGTAGFLKIHSGADVTLDSIPVIASPIDPITGSFVPGVKLRIQNSGATSITLLDHEIYLTNISLGALQIVLNPGDIIDLISDNIGSSTARWHVIGPSYSHSYGNTGRGTGRVVTVNNAPTPIYPNITTNSGVVASGTYIEWTIQGNARGGLDYAVFKGRYRSDTARNSVFVIDSNLGTNGNAPPAGWTVTASPSGTAAASIFVTGDNTGNPVTWIIKADHCDGSS